MMLLQTSIIDTIFSRGTQSWKYVVTCSLEGLKVRFNVERDSYDNQSRIFSEVWSGTELKWNRIQTLEGKSYGHLPSAYNRDDSECIDEAHDVVRVMFEYAKMILA